MRTRSGYSSHGEIASSGTKGNQSLSGRGLAILKIRELSVQYVENLSAYPLGPWLAFRLTSFFSVGSRAVIARRLSRGINSRSALPFETNPSDQGRMLCATVGIAWAVRKTIFVA